MKPETLEKNLALLRKKDPSLAAVLSAVQPSGKYEVSPSQAGPMTLARIFPDRTRRTLHSSYNPQQEASRFLNSCRIEDSANFIVTGLGLGHHVLDLVNRAGASARILIIENDPELARLAMLHNDLAPVINHPGVSFFVGLSLNDLGQALEGDRIDFTLNGYIPVAFKPLVENDPEYYAPLHMKLKSIFQETHVDLKTQAAFSKLFYTNIINNWDNIRSSPGVRVVKKAFQGHPAIIISAGPSLDKNIGFLKSAADNALLISVGTALKPLLQNGIVPDFVVAVDPDEINIKAFDLDTLPKDLWLVYDPCVTREIPDRFPERKLVFDSNIVLARWIAENIEAKGALGKIFSVAHTSFLFAKHLGCDPLILVGQDLSFAGRRLHCSGTYYNQTHQDSVGDKKTLDILEKQKHEGFAQSMASALDLFDRPVTTTVALEIYKERFAEEIDASCRVYNATEGGIPIPGAPNLSLREALISHCTTDIRNKKSNLAINIKTSSAPKNTPSVLNKQSNRFKRILDQIDKIKSMALVRPDGTCNKKTTFVHEMENFYKVLLEDEETVKLMQGYHYAGFIEWNQENSSISRKSPHWSEQEIIEEKFERDRKFLDVALEAALFLQQSFQTMKNSQI